MENNSTHRIKNITIICLVVLCLCMLCGSVLAAIDFGLEGGSLGVAGVESVAPHEHDYTICVGKYYNRIQHYERWECICGAIMNKNYQYHEYSESSEKCIYCSRPKNGNPICTSSTLLEAHSNSWKQTYTKINDTTHELKITCTICNVSKRINANHNYINGICVCESNGAGKEKKCSFPEHNIKVEVNSWSHILSDGKLSLGMHFIKQNDYCEECNLRFNEVERVVNHTLEGTDIKKIDGEKHTITLSCTSGCKDAKKIEAPHEFNIDGVCIFCNEKEVNEVYRNYSPNDFGNSKPKIEENTYTDAEWNKMEKVLKARVEKAGFGTRAGVVEAALYLASLDYAVPYRGAPVQRDAYIGAYNKIGLNRTWGKKVSISRDIGSYSRGYKEINGLDCGGFVTWALVNGGVLKEGETIYAHPKNYTNNTPKHISVIGNEIEPGDFVFTKYYPSWSTTEEWSHVGLVVGVDEENVYVAESTTGNYRKLVVTKVSKNLSKSTNKLAYYSKGDSKLYKAKNADGTENKGNMPVVW